MFAAWQSHGERRSPPRPALHFDRATMRLRDPFTNGQPKSRARALTRARARGVRAPETIEHVWQVPGRDADAGVGDREDHAPIVAAQLNRHLPTARCVLDGVLDEIERELANPAAIDRHDDRLGRQVNLDRDPRMLGQQLPRLPRLFDDLANVDGLLMEIRATFV